MKKYFLGIITGFIACTMLVSTMAIANIPIKLIVNGREVVSDVPPQIISGRTMIPARPLAEALGADVRWDEANYAVVVTGGVQSGAVPTDLEANNSPASQPVSQIEKEEEFIPSEWVVEDELGRYGLTVVKDEKIGTYHFRKNNRSLVTPKDFAFDKNGKVFNMNIRGENFRFRMVDGKMYVNKKDLESFAYFDEEIVYKTIASPENKLKKMGVNTDMEEWVDVRSLTDKYAVSVTLNDDKKSFFFGNKGGFTITMHYDRFPKDGTPYIMNTAKYGILRMKMVDSIIYFNITDFINANILRAKSPSMPE